MTLGIWVREASMDEIEEVAGLNAALFREDAGRRDDSVNLGWPVEEGWEHFVGLVASEEGSCLISSSEEEIAGYLAGYVRDGSTLRPARVAELESMYVREEYRGGAWARSWWTHFSGGPATGERSKRRSRPTRRTRALRLYRREGFRQKSTSLEMGL